MTVTPAMPSTRIAVGDRVRFNDSVGRVLSVNGVTAVVVERNNRAFRKTVKWRLSLDALVRIAGTAPRLPEGRDDAERAV